MRNIKLLKNKFNDFIFILIDSTGLKAYGQGEWHVKLDKASKRRTWRKLSLVVDPVSHKIIDNNLTTSNINDSIAAIPMIDNLLESIQALWGDGAYDSSTIYKILLNKHIKPIIPLHSNTILTKENFRK